MSYQTYVLHTSFLADDLLHDGHARVFVAELPPKYNLHIIAQESCKDGNFLKTLLSNPLGPLFDASLDSALYRCATSPCSFVCAFLCSRVAHQAFRARHDQLNRPLLVTILCVVVVMCLTLRCSSSTCLLREGPTALIVSCFGQGYTLPQPGSAHAHATAAIAAARALAGGG